MILDRARAVAGAQKSHPKGPEAVAALDAIGEGRFCRVKVDSDGVFSVPPQEWQAALAWRYVIVEYGDSYLAPGFSLATAATWMRASGLVHPGFREPLESDVIKALRRADSDFRSPQMLVKQYLQGVVRLGPLVPLEKDRWERRPEFDVAVRTAQDDERRRVERIEDVRRRVLALVAQATEQEREGFEVETWEREPVEGIGLTLDAIVREAKYTPFEEGLGKIEAAGFFDPAGTCSADHLVQSYIPQDARVSLTDSTVTGSTATVTVSVETPSIFASWPRRACGFWLCVCTKTVPSALTYLVWKARAIAAVAIVVLRLAAAHLPEPVWSHGLAALAFILPACAHAPRAADHAAAPAAALPQMSITIGNDRVTLSPRSTVVVWNTLVDPNLR